MTTDIKIPSELRRIKPGNLFIIGALALMYLYIHWTGGMNQTMQFMLGGIIVVVLLSSMWSAPKVPLTEQVAKELGLKRAGQLKQDGLLGSGDIEPIAQAALRKSTIGGETILDSWDVCVQVSDPLSTQFVFRLHPYTGAIEKIFKTHNWDPTKEPDKEIITPPSIFEWIQRKRESERQIDRMSGVGG